MGKSGASPHGAGLGESQGKVIQARGKSGACQGQARGKSGAPWRLNPKAPSSPPPMVPGAATQVVSPESQATVYTCPIDHAWGACMGAMVRGRVSVGQGTPLGAWSFVHTSYFLQSHWPPLALASCALALFCAPFFLFYTCGWGGNKGGRGQGK